MSVEPKPRPLNHLWNTAQVAGIIVSLTGLTPDRRISAFLDFVQLPAGFSWGYLTLGMSLTASGRDVEAQLQLQKMRNVEPDFTRQHVEDFLSHTLLNTEHAEKMIAQVRQVWRD